MHMKNRIFICSRKTLKGSPSQVLMSVNRVDIISSQKAHKGIEKSGLSSTDATLQRTMLPTSFNVKHYSAWALCRLEKERPTMERSVWEEYIKERVGKAKSSFPLQAGILLHILQLSVNEANWPEAKNPVVMETSLKDWHFNRWPRNED